MRKLVIHGHFYQPPREDPWTGVIRPQPSAMPFADWNQRITAECYRPNGRAAILGVDGQVASRMNTYAYMSFNFGPTLLRWMSSAAPDVLEALIDADRQSRERLGFGNAMAQAYHHSILPLANAEDKRTEIHWGIADFEYRFRRLPEGMWLPETAVDTATLEALAEAGIQFVILAPRQAEAVLGPDDEDWQTVAADTVETGRPYRVDLPSGAHIAAFFYAPSPAQGVAFDGWLNNGEEMAARLAEMPDDLVHYATDGESYGHHHRHGEMALAYCLRTLVANGDLDITNYAAVLASEPVTHRARIVENSSWSCAHGVGRWSRNCGCVMDHRRAGQQEWRRVLRNAMNALRDELADFYVRRMIQLGEDPWEIRNRYVAHLYANESSKTLIEDPISGGAGSKELKGLLEMQRHALMMFTSCGWFFDDPGGLEAMQILRYAHRAIRIHEQLGGKSLEPFFLDHIDPLESMDLNVSDGSRLYAQHVVPDLEG